MYSLTHLLTELLATLNSTAICGIDLSPAI
nr:MAG TPA: hypothetical protein [Caudoviricetes sp.]